MSEVFIKYPVGNKFVSEQNAFIIAEVGSNHSQDYEVAARYVSAAAECGVDAVKFQFFDADDLVSKDHPARIEVEGYVTPIEWIPRLQEECLKNDVIFFASTFNSRLFEVVDNSGVPLHKIASSEVLNPSLLLSAGRTAKPILISFGMSEWFEVEIAMKILSETGNSKIIPMHCISKYPLEVESSNLQVITELKKRFGGIVGFSDHTESVEIGGWAAMLGARVFEKHITLDRTLEGADHSYALEPKEFANYVNNIRLSIESLGSGKKTYLPDELNGRRRFGAYLETNAEVGVQVKDLDFNLARPRTPVPEILLNFVKDLSIKNVVASGDELRWEDLK
jgi:N,N'-diacetyllegionaminate synthase